MFDQVAFVLYCILFKDLKRFSMKCTLRKIYTSVDIPLYRQTFFKHVFYILRSYYSTSTKEQPANILNISMVNHLLKQNPEMTCKELCKELSI